MIKFIKDLTIRRYYILKILWDKKGSYFDKTAWIKSFKAKRPLDSSGNPVPWLTIGMNEFLAKRLSTDMDILEYGSGNSTLYLSKRVKSVQTIEYDQEWLNILKKDIGKNVVLEYVQLDESDAYENAHQLFKLKEFDLIFIDGRRRVKSLIASVETLSARGVVIFDDTQREKYNSCFDIMKQKGFKEISFWGMSTGSIEYKCTTVFYKENNCLSI